MLRFKFKICSILFTAAIVQFLFSSDLKAQGDFGIPLELAGNNVQADRPPTPEEIVKNFNQLLADPDTTLNGAKKRASRWMAYTMPYLSRDSSGNLTKKPFTEAVKSIYSSAFQCGGNDNADWVEDGPTSLPSWNFGGVRQQFSGWIDGVYSIPSNPDTIIIGTRTSGIMRTENGGINWNCETDDLPFPVLGIRQFLGDPNDDMRVLAITGTDKIEGGLIYTDDGGETWTQNTQNLPEFHWMSYHPTIDSLVFAVSQRDIYISYNSGNTFQFLAQPPGFTSDTDKKQFHQILVLESKFYCLSHYVWNSIDEIFECNISNINMTNETINLNWDADPADDFIDSNRWLRESWFSNIALGRYYLLIEQVDTTGGDFTQFKRRVYKSSDSGMTHTELTNLGSTGETDLSGETFIHSQTGNNKCELIASPNDSNVVYNGVVKRMRRFDDSDPDALLNYITISGESNETTGHHDDYRCSHVYSLNGADKIFLGNDGGIGVVNDGLSSAPTIRSANGDLSINLLHAFNVHEATGKTVFAFQDHKMISRESDGSYSNTFLFEGSVAMIQQHYPDAIVGASIRSIRDKNEQDNPIVSSNFVFTTSNPDYSGSYLGAYQVLYRNYPERFASGLAGGQVALNRAKNISDFENIPQFRNHTTDPDDYYKVGTVAVCQRDPNFIYAAKENWINDGTGEVLVKSINDASDTDDNNNWISLKNSPVTFADGTTQTLSQRLVWREIRALEVDHFDGNILYCGIGRIYNTNDEIFRVIRSTDGGATFTDWSEGLPALPVERLLTVESDNHLIFAATSVGIYYRTDNDSTWQCFSEGLPKVQITGLQYDYCNNILYASTYGRGLWKTPVNLPMTNSFSVTVSEDETWDENKTIHTDVTVEEGAELTITAIIRMATGTNIIVEPGALLTLDGGILTNACGAMWQGIIIKGNTDLPQTISNQGVVVTKNDATIANARTALKFIYPDDWSSRGGIAWCKNTTFYNNKRSAAFYKYPGTDELETYDNIPDYKSYFIDCEFLFDNQNLLTEGEDAPFSQVTLWGVKGVKFLGCKFENTEDVSQSEFRSRGIFSSDASYRIDDYCEVPIPVGGTCPTASLVPSSFSGYHTAVHPSGVAGNYSPTIRDTEFDQNMVGVYLDLANFSEVVDNEFTVGDHPYDSPLPLEDLAGYHTGVITQGLTGFTIEENKFYGDDTNTDFTHGVAIQSGGGSSVAVYRNEMTNLGSGTIGVGDNHDSDGAYGLRFLCNENSGNLTDFEVRGIIGVNESGYVDESLNGFDHPSQEAGNTFSAGDGFNDNFVHFDFASDKEYTYQYADAEAARIPSDDETNIVPDPPGDIYHDLTTIANSCPTNYPVSGGPDKYVLKSEFRSEKSAYYNLLYTYHQFIDQGNTEAALNDVALSWSTDAWTLRDELMARSPYNSDTVLIAAADKNILPHGMLLEVLISNPDALRNGNVINHVKCCIADPMPEYMIDILYASRNVQTARTLTERNLGNLRQKMALKHRMVVNILLRDSLGAHPDTLTNWLDEMRHKEGRYSLVSEYLGRGDFAHARETMDSLQSQLKLGGAGTKELNKMRQFTTFLENLDGQGKNIAQLDSTQIDYLIAMANDPESGTAGARAENILCFFHGICAPPPSAPKSNVVSARKPKPTAEELIREQNHVTISPNPADQYVQLEYDLLFSKENTEMNIYDQLGRKSSSYTIGTNTRGVEILDTRKMAQGVYIIEIVQEGKQVFSDKIIVQH